MMLNKKILKKVLLWTDDFDNDSLDTLRKLVEKGDIFYHKSDNYLKFEIDANSSLKEMKRLFTEKDYDALLIDYGLIGNHKEVVSFLRKANSRTKLAWYGGMPTVYYNTDAKSLFPQDVFLHDLRGSKIGYEDTLFLLYDLLGNKTTEVKCRNSSHA